jgi:hypothetical protein
MNRRNVLRDERGIALVVVLLVALAVSAIAIGAGMMTTTTHAINLYGDRMGTLESAAEAGMEWGRAKINGNDSLYPDSSYTVLESNASVLDASGNVIPNVRRSVYVGPTGVTSGQYGVFGSVVVEVTDNTGNKIVRRGEVYQESFAKYAYFTDNEGGNIYFGGGDQIWGPVHSNDQIKIHSTGAWFHNQVETAEDVYQANYGTFDQGYIEYGTFIPMPTTAELTKLRTQALSGSTAIVGNTTGNYGQATTRIEFIAIDMDGDGQTTGANEGFMRVYQVNNGADAWWVTGDLTPGNAYTQNTENCGDWNAAHLAALGPPPTLAGGFKSSARHGAGDPHTALSSVQQATRRCYLGGSDSLYGAFQANDARGRWLTWPGAVDPAVLAARPADAAYLYPITRQYNPNFKGVIHVEGNVAISGTLRGQVTLAATGNIVIADDVRYATDPGAGTCADILGIFSGNDVIVADNTLNRQQQSNNGGGFRTYDATSDEFIHGVVLALNIFTVENYNGGPNGGEACQGTNWGRGCLFLTGGIIQDTRGAVGTTGGTGYLKRYAYDQCAATSPPPYFPTTGHFARGRFFEVDPVGFDVTSYYGLLTP